jgi:hypothetical protein
VGHQHLASSVNSWPFLILSDGTHDGLFNPWYSKQAPWPAWELSANG